jgi:hypothetical protein
MVKEVCYWYLCFVPPNESNVPHIFGFAEFISALALLIITYTLVDVRYRFRIAIAPSPLYKLTFAIIGVIGVETLLTEVWLAQGWWLPKTAFLTDAIWQGYFGLLFLVTFMTWVWYAYIRPPIYDRRNYKQYAQELYGVIVKGADSELAVIADEIIRSAKSLITFAPSKPRRFVPLHESSETKADQLSEVEGYAHDVLMLIANRKLCRHIIASAPSTAIVLFQEAAEAKKHHLPMSTFAKNISAEAIANPDSILYHETDEFSSGLLGHIKPFSQAIYGNYALVEGLGEHVGSPLDVGYEEYWGWTASHWKAYCRAVSITLEDYLEETGGYQHTHAINSALETIKHSFSDTYKLNEITASYYSTDVFRRLEVAVNFIKDAVKIIDRQEQPPHLGALRRRKGDHQNDIYDRLANLMFELVLAAASVSGPPDKAWGIHHNAVWGQFFTLATKNHTWKILQFKLRRLLYDEIASMDKIPNFMNAKILGYCLNVLGLELRTGTYGREYRALAKAVQAWAHRGYPKLRQTMPRVADAVLIGSITYDEQNNRLVKTYLQGLRDEPSRDCLGLARLSEQGQHHSYETATK